MSKSTVTADQIGIYCLAARMLYDTCPAGGPLHIIIDDQNVLDRNIEFCRAEAHKPEYALVLFSCVSILGLLDDMSIQERYWLVSEFYDGSVDVPEKLAEWDIPTAS